MHIDEITGDDFDRMADTSIIFTHQHTGVRISCKLEACIYDILFYTITRCRLPLCWGNVEVDLK